MKTSTSASPLLTLASRNAHKIEELSELLAGLWQVRGIATLAPDLTWNETGSTFRENAMIKARAVQQAIGGYVLADDSGLQVDYLQGAPGVFSSSYGGREGDSSASNAKLLDVLKDVPESQRGAQFFCCLCLLTPSGDAHFFEGQCRGRILATGIGNQGFGYDPLFFVSELGKSMAELSMVEKNTLSHRARAMHKFLQFKPD